MKQNVTSHLLRFTVATLIILFGSKVYAEDSSLLVLSAGHAGIFDSDLKDPAVFKVEYRFKPTSYWKLAPGVGVSRTTGDAMFVFVFVERDFYLSEHWVLSPNFGTGLFDDGKNLRLGKDLEFRSGIRFAYQFDNDMRVGLELFHLSNAGLGDRNPGTEPAFLSLSIPL